MIRVVHPGSWIRMLTSTHPGSRIQGSKRQRIPDPQHWDHWTVFGKGKTKEHSHCQAKQNRTRGCSTYRVCRSGIMELRFLSLEKCSILNMLHDKWTYTVIDSTSHKNVKKTLFPVELSTKTKQNRTALDKVSWSKEKNVPGRIRIKWI